MKISRGQRGRQQKVVLEKHDYGCVEILGERHDASLWFENFQDKIDFAVRLLRKTPVLELEKHPQLLKILSIVRDHERVLARGVYDSPRSQTGQTFSGDM